MKEKVCRGNTLLCTYGLPRSGKSTWARSTGYPIVSPDALRWALTGRRWYSPMEHQVWAMARTMVRALFLAGHKTVVLDSTSCTRKQRDQFRSDEMVMWDCEYIRINTPPHICKERAELTYPELVPIIDYMVAHWERIDPNEGPVTDCHVVPPLPHERGDLTP
jgi:predicted kinase